MATGEQDVREEDRLPWLESVENEEKPGPPWAVVALLAAVGLGLIFAIVWGVHWYRNRGSDVVGDGTLIAAPVDPYKVKPDVVGGMQVGGEGDTALATSQGGALGNGSINLAAAPEAPVDGRRAAPAQAGGAQEGALVIPQSGGQLTAANPGAAMGSARAASSGGSLVQLGSYPSQGQANAEWTAKAGRFGYLSQLGHTVEQAAVNGRTVYRLRVNAGSAGAAQVLCGKLKVAGEACFIPN